MDLRTRDCSFCPSSSTSSSRITIFDSNCRRLRGERSSRMACFSATSMSRFEAIRSARRPGSSMFMTTTFSSSLSVSEESMIFRKLFATPRM